MLSHTPDREDATAPTGSLHFSLTPVAQADDVLPVWNAIDAPAERGFFLSWHWIGCWLDCLPSNVTPYLLTLREDTKPIAAAILICASAHRLALVPARRWRFHETGDRALDALSMEDNGLRCAGDRSADRLLSDALIWLGRNLPPHEDIVIMNLDGDLAPAVERAAARMGHVMRVLTESDRHYVDLPRLVAGGVGDPASAHLDSLGRNTRAALRRSLRMYGERGPVVLRWAESVAEALEFLEAMRPLHQEYWQARGFPGAYAQDSWVRFHRRLIAGCFGVGVIAFARVTAGDHVIGYLYNVRYGGWMHSYQSGFAYEADNRLKPGLVSHHLAIAEAGREGLAAYDFLAGDVRYKRDLANAKRRFSSIALVAPSMSGRLETVLRRIKRQLFPR